MIVKELTFIGKDFARAMKAVVPHVGKDSRTDWIELKYDGNTAATFTGLDGYTLAHITIPVMSDSDEAFTAQLLPMKCPKCGFTRVQVSDDGNVRVAFLGTGVEICCPASGRRFADYAPLLAPSAPQEYAIAVNPALLAKACASCTNGKQAVVLRFRSPVSPIIMEGAGVTCLVLPVRSDKV